jgi:nitrate reductase cytochrome c-type subunit
MSESHFKDLRHAPEVLRDELAGARWYCTSCHVSQSDAEPLVDNPPRARFGHTPLEDA